ncbi:hypothetical protein ACLJJ6_10000 [Pediococcus siamensis]|uniref:hypothetical protein n=1 Tax=Pediococcus siamensis TaxID=381829 RepID=UPI00399F01FE
MTIHENESESENEKDIESRTIYGKYMYGEIIRDFPSLIDSLGRLIIQSASTCIDLLGLAQSLHVRIEYSSKLKTAFELYRPQSREFNHHYEDILVVTDHQVTYQQQAWLVGEGLAKYILSSVEYVPDFSKNTDAMTKWSVESLAAKLLLPNDLVEHVTDLAIDMNKNTLNIVDFYNQDLIFNTPRVTIIGHTAAQLANVPEWLMKQRMTEFYDG